MIRHRQERAFQLLAEMVAEMQAKKSGQNGAPAAAQPAAEIQALPIQANRSEIQPSAELARRPAAW